MIKLPEVTEIRKRRKSLGISQFALAKKARVSAPTINTLENGKTIDPSYSTVKKLWDTLMDLENMTKLESKTKAGEICEKNLIKIKSTSSLNFANKLFDQNKSISQIPVFDEDGLLVGLLTEKSLRKEMANTGWQERKTKDAIDSNPPTVDYHIPLKIVEKYLEQYQCVFVRSQSENKIIGIIVDWDIRRYYKEET